LEFFSLRFLTVLINKPLANISALNVSFPNDFYLKTVSKYINYWFLISKPLENRGFANGYILKTVSKEFF
jgi:hypothetical protein